MNESSFVFVYLKSVLYHNLNTQIKLNGKIYYNCYIICLN